MTYSVTLSDGTKLDNLALNGNNHIICLHHCRLLNDFFVKRAAGYSINYRSSDRKDLNTKSAIFSFEVGQRNHLRCV